MIVFTAIVPHPPVGIPGIGRQEDVLVMEKTLNAFDVLRQQLERTSPDVVVIISPHAPLEPYRFVINSNPILRGNFSQFALDEVAQFRNDIEIVEMIEYACEQNEIPSHLHKHFLDHGVMIPFHHLLQNISPHVVHLSFSFLNLRTHYNYGELIKIICEKSPKRIAIIASGDLSHRLTPDAPAGYSPRAKMFDSHMIEGLRRRDLAMITSLHRDFMKDAGECGLRAFVILLGTMHGREVEFELLSYEHPFGVGYLVARYV